VAGPAKEARHAEATLEDLGLCERSLTAIWPSENFGAVVGGEYNDSVLVLTTVFSLSSLSSFSCALASGVPTARTVLPPSPKLYLFFRSTA
jgi:hypothetical protein